MRDPGSVTGLLLAWGQGDEAALEPLIPMVERELHRIAKRCMAGERAGHSRQATALVNEALPAARRRGARQLAGPHVEELRRLSSPS